MKFLQSNEVLAVSNFKRFADDEFNAAKMMVSVRDWVRSLSKTLWKSISSFSTMFSKGFLLRVVTSQNCV